MAIKLTLTEALDRVQAFYASRCGPRGSAKAVFDSKQIVECLDFGERYKELTVDSISGSLVAIRDWNPADTTR